MAVEEVYPASPIKRSRATNRDGGAGRVPDRLCRRTWPVTVRQLYYQAEVPGLPGIDKTEGGYDKVQARF